MFILPILNRKAGPEKERLFVMTDGDLVLIVYQAVENENFNSLLKEVFHLDGTSPRTDLYYQVADRQHPHC